MQVFEHLPFKVNPLSPSLSLSVSLSHIQKDYSMFDTALEDETVEAFLKL